MALLDTQNCDAPSEAVDQTTSKTHEISNANPQSGQDKTQKRGAAGENSSIGTELAERPIKRAKRGKYISRACTSCHQRKIKCEGGDPCRQCLAKQLPCRPSAPRGGQQDRRDSETGPNGNQGHSYDSSSDGANNREVLARLEAVEHHLCQLQSHTPDITRPVLSHISVDNQLKSSATNLLNDFDTEGQIFAGEITITPTFQDENERLDHNYPVSSAMHRDYTPPISSFRPPVITPGDITGQTRGWFESIFTRHGITTDELQCRYYLQVFFDEVHPMYPILHQPAVWDSFNEMWQHPGLNSLVDSNERAQLRVSLALVCFCLALGRCSISTRIADRSGIDSSGWSLHEIGMGLLGDILETSNTAMKSLHLLQVLMVRVIYLFRLDANQKAARVHAITVSVAHTIGLHRQSTIESMPAYYNQLYSRTWWALYLLDRRLALESGKPYLIQDSNADTILPLDLSDEWMTRFASRKETLADLQQELVPEIARNSSPSSIPYVVAMVRYSRIAGKTWDSLYGVKALTTSISAMVEYVDTAICKLIKTADKGLQYDPDIPYDVQFSTRPRWRVKQTFLLHTCCTYLRLLIRRPLIPSPRSIYHTEEDDLESSIECAGLAARILMTHQRIKDDEIKYSFALSHYITSCAIIMIGLVSREPGSKRRYGDVILAATQCLNGYCQKYWVSVTMMRCVSRLSRVVERILAVEQKESQDRQSPSRIERDSVWRQMTQHLTPPLSEDQDTGKMQYSMEAFNIFSNQLEDSTVETGRSAQSDQGADYYSFQNDPLSSVVQRSTEDLTKLPMSWMAEPGHGRRDSCVMSDFTFETFGQCLWSQDARLSTFMGDDKLGPFQNMGSTIDQGPSEANVGGLGMNEVFDLDMDLGLTMMTPYAS